MTNKIITVTVLVFLSTFYFNIRAENLLNITMELSPPYAYIIEGEAKGVSVELVYEVLKRAGIKNINLKVDSSKGVANSINSNQSDLIVLTSNKKNESAFFTSKLLWRKYVFFKRKSLKQNDLFDKEIRANISVVENDFNVSGFIEIFKKKPNNFILYVDDDLENIEYLLNEKSDLLVGDYKVIKNIIENESLSNEIEVLSYGDSNQLQVLFYSPIYIYYPREKVPLEFVNELEDILDSMKIDGEYFEILKKYENL